MELPGGSDRSSLSENLRESETGIGMVRVTRLVGMKVRPLPWVLL